MQPKQVPQAANAVAEGVAIHASHQEESFAVLCSPPVFVSCNCRNVLKCFEGMDTSCVANRLLNA